MAIPTTYSEMELGEYMLRITGSVSTPLSWTRGDFAEAINETLLRMDVDTVEEVTEIPKLRALAKVEAWRAIVDATVGDVNYAADGANFSMAQRHTQAVQALERALAAAAEYADASESAIEIGSMGYSDSYASRCE